MESAASKKKKAETVITVNVEICYELWMKRKVLYYANTLSLKG
jgi:hypothetical protein